MRGRRAARFHPRKSWTHQNSETCRATAFVSPPAGGHSGLSRCARTISDRSHRDGPHRSRSSHHAHCFTTQRFHKPTSGVLFCPTGEPRQTTLQPLARIDRGPRSDSVLRWKGARPCRLIRCLQIAADKNRSRSIGLVVMLSIINAFEISDSSTASS